MVQKQERTGISTDPGPANLIPMGFGNLGQKPAEAMLEMQKQVLSACERASQNWLGRVQLEADFALKFTQRMTAAKTIPDVAFACQEWVGEHMTQFVEDGQKLMAEGQKLADVSTRLLSNGGDGGRTSS